MIRFAGLSRFSLVNYPEKMSCVLFTKGCPLSCPYCYNKCLLTEPEIDHEEIWNFLKKRSKTLQAIVITGGEPMVYYKDLESFIDKVKGLGYLVGIHITGLNSDKEEFKRIISKCDWIGLDFKGPFYKYGKLFNLHESFFKTALKTLKEQEKFFEVRTTLAEELNKADLLEMAEYLRKNNVNEWVLQRRMVKEGEFIVPNFDLTGFNINIKIR